MDGHNYQWNAKVILFTSHTPEETGTPNTENSPKLDEAGPSQKCTHCPLGNLTAVVL